MQEIHEGVLAIVLPKETPTNDAPEEPAEA